MNAVAIKTHESQTWSQHLMPSEVTLGLQDGHRDLCTVFFRKFDTRKPYLLHVKTTSSGRPAVQNHLELLAQSVFALAC